MRYQVNEELFVIHFDYASLRNQEKQFRAADFRLPFMYGDNEAPSQINLDCLKVTEHHLVPWDQDDKEEKKYDGYLLQAQDGAVFANQYPFASYSQVSDTGNRRFNYHVPDDADHSAYIKKMDSGEIKVYEYCLMREVVENMTRGVEGMEKRLTTDRAKYGQEDLDFAQLMKDRLTGILASIKEAFKKKYPQWDYEVKKVPLVKENNFLVERCIFTKIENHGE